MTQTIIKMPVRDRMLQGNNMSIVVGPLQLPTRDKFVDALQVLGRRGPQARVGYRYNGRNAWAYDADALDATCENMVISFDDDDPATVTEQAATFAQAQSDYPLRVYVSQSHFIMVYHHALGDAQAAFATIDAIFAIARGDETTWGSKQESELAVLKTFWHTFVRQPKQLREAFRAKKYAQPVDHGGSKYVVSRPGQLAFGVVETDKTRELNQFSRKAGASINTVLFDALRRRFNERGIHNDAAFVTYDLRRYLPENVYAGGNFIAALPFSEAALASPAGLTKEHDHNVQAGLPLLASSFGVAKETIRPVQHGNQPHFSPLSKARLVFSGMGVVRAIERLPWNAATGSPFYAAYVTPGEGNEITMNIIKVKNRMFISASFYPEAYKAEDVQQAIQDVIENPVYFLQDATAPATATAPAATVN